VQIKERESDYQFILLKYDFNQCFVR